MSIISLEGNIGCGKEQFIDFFKKYFTDDLMFLDDSLYTWENENFLKNFYNNPERWSFTLEIYSTIQKYQKLKKIEDDVAKVVVTRRSPISNRTCFIKASKEMNYINDKEFSIYNDMFETLDIPKIHGIIYLKSNVNRCYESLISKKNTMNTKNINFTFLQKIHNNYEEWINKLKEENIPILEINVENFRDIDGNEQIQEKLFSIIVEKFPKMKQCIKVHRYANNNWTVVKKKSKNK